MQFINTKLEGAYIVELNPISDERGYFSRCWCKKEFSERSLETNIVQCNMSGNLKKGTLRGMHYQKAPYEETKFIRCISGAVFDVIVDLREESPTYRQWIGVELSAKNKRALYIPKGFAHGYLTLEDDSEVLYMVTEYYCHDSEAAIRWDDPAIGIEWPIENIESLTISEKDKSHKLLI